MENLGDDFSLTVDHGVIEPKSEFGLQMHFRAIKAVNVKKVVRLEASLLFFVASYFDPHHLTIFVQV